MRTSMHVNRTNLVVVVVVVDDDVVYTTVKASLSLLSLSLRQSIA
jgi:hypothetical protein